jgi:hypothetical protein
MRLSLSRAAFVAVGQRSPQQLLPRVGQSDFHHSYVVTLLGENAVLTIVAFLGFSGFLGSPVGHAIYCFFFIGLWGVNIQSRRFFSLSQVWSSLIWHNRYLLPYIDAPFSPGVFQLANKVVFLKGTAFRPYVNALK